MSVRIETAVAIGFLMRRLISQPTPRAGRQRLKSFVRFPFVSRTRGSWPTDSKTLRIGRGEHVTAG
jgi:hypothetical protein